VKTVTPKQLELTAGKTREELLLATAPHIDPESPVFKASMKTVEKIELEDAKTVLAQAGPPRPEVEFEDFNWHDDPSVVLKSQPATAIYYNPNGCIVIRQERSLAEESDPFVYITPENAVTFMEALAKRARE
jgi:hypothetical protein